MPEGSFFLHVKDPTVRLEAGNADREKADPSSRTLRFPAAVVAELRARQGRLKLARRQAATAPGVTMRGYQLREVDARAISRPVMLARLYPALTA